LLVKSKSAAKISGDARKFRCWPDFNLETAEGSATRETAPGLYRCRIRFRARQHRLLATNESVGGFFDTIEGMRKADARRGKTRAAEEAEKVDLVNMRRKRERRCKQSHP
jgi:hypothetical protein